MILAQKEIHQSVKQNREPSNKPMHSWSIYDKGSKNIQRKSQSLQYVVLGKQDSYL